MTRRFLIGSAFIEALTAQGVLPPATISVEIRARVGEPVTLDYTTVADERLIGVVAGMEATDDPDEAGPA